MIHPKTKKMIITNDFSSEYELAKSLLETNNLSEDLKTYVMRKEAHKLLSEAKVAISKLESLGVDYSVFRVAKLSNRILKQVKEKLDFVH